MAPGARSLRGENTAQVRGERSSRSFPRQPAIYLGDLNATWERERVESSQHHDAAAFVDLYVAYQPRIGTYCDAILHNASDAEDAVQETFLRAWQQLPDLVDMRYFYAWLRVIAHNVCIDIVRKRARSRPVDNVELDALGSPSPSTEDTVLDRLGIAVVAEAANHLSPRHREVLHLREGLEWSYQQIAAHDGVPVSTVETLLFRARRALRKEIVALREGRGESRHPREPKPNETRADEAFCAGSSPPPRCSVA